MRPATTISWMAILSLAVLCSLASVSPTLAGAKTSKERLSDKASDDQRVDNCHVPLERRGPTPRPDCPTTIGSGQPVGEQSTDTSKPR